jgi:cell division protein FtsW (lipid II flippase)
MVAVGVVVLFAAMNLTAWLPDPRVLLRERGPWLSRLVVGVFVLILCAVAYLSLPERAAVLPARLRPADSLVVLFAIAITALLAVAVMLPGSMVTARAVNVTTVLCVAAVFGLTRDLGTAVALFCASIAVLVSATGGPSAAAAEVGSAEPPAWRTFVPFSLAIFAAGVSMVIAFGSLALRIPRFGFGDALGYSDRHPAPFSTGQDFMNLMEGSGLDRRLTQLWHGEAGSPPDVLALIGHEAGVSSLLGLMIVSALLFFSLARLAAQVENRTGAAMAWGLIVFLVAQCLLAVETLFPAFVSIGEGPPLLSGGWADYLADLIAIGIVIGLSRGAGQPAPAAPVRTRPQQSQAVNPA